LRFKELSRSYSKQARARYRTAKLAYDQRNYPYCIRQAQESVELTLKGALKLVGVQYPKFLDVSEALLSNVHLFPEWFRKRVDEMAKVSKELARKRAAAMYGEEAKGLPPETVFDRRDANKAVNDAKRVLDACKKLFA
jgi:HEPN domain-containing protein